MWFEIIKMCNTHYIFAYQLLIRIYCLCKHFECEAVILKSHQYIVFNIFISHTYGPIIEKSNWTLSYKLLYHH